MRLEIFASIPFYSCFSVNLEMFFPLFWIFVFMLLNVSVCFCSHSLILFGVVLFSIFNIGRTVSEILVGLCMNLVRW